MTGSLTLNLVPAMGGLARFTFTQAGPDTGSIRLETWQAGHALAGTADAVVDAVVYAIRADPDRLMVRCMSDHTVLFFTVPVTIDVVGTEASRDGMVTTPRLTVSFDPHPIGQGSAGYEVSGADLGRMKTFLAAADFPRLG